MKKQCPNCNATLSWSELWRMSGWLAWRRPRPCPRCGTPLRRSAMTYLTHFGSLGLISSMVAQLIYRDPSWLAPLGLGFAVVMLVSAVATRLEEVPQERNASPD